jgi:hypothetical protein
MRSGFRIHAIHRLPGQHRQGQSQQIAIEMDDYEINK